MATRDEAWYGGRHELDAQKREGRRGVVNNIINKHYHEVDITSLYF